LEHSVVLTRQNPSQHRTHSCCLNISRSRCVRNVDPLKTTYNVMYAVPAVRCVRWFCERILIHYYIRIPTYITLFTHSLNPTIQCFVVMSMNVKELLTFFSTISWSFFVQISSKSFFLQNAITLAISFVFHPRRISCVASNY